MPQKVFSTLQEYQEALNNQGTSPEDIQEREAAKNLSLESMSLGTNIQTVLEQIQTNYIEDKAQEKDKDGWRNVVFRLGPMMNLLLYFGKDPATTVFSEDAFEMNLNSLKYDVQRTLFDRSDGKKTNYQILVEENVKLGLKQGYKLEDVYPGYQKSMDQTLKSLSEKLGFTFDKKKLQELWVPSDVIPNPVFDEPGKKKKEKKADKKKEKKKTKKEEKEEKKAEEQEEKKEEKQTPYTEYKGYVRKRVRSRENSTKDQLMADLYELWALNALEDSPNPNESQQYNANSVRYFRNALPNQKSIREATSGMSEKEISETIQSQEKMDALILKANNIQKQIDSFKITVRTLPEKKDILNKHLAELNKTGRGEYAGFTRWTNNSGEFVKAHTALKTLVSGQELDGERAYDLSKDILAYVNRYKERERTSEMGRGRFNAFMGVLKETMSPESFQGVCDDVNKARKMLNEPFGEQYVSPEDFGLETTAGQLSDRLTELHRVKRRDGTMTSQDYAREIAALRLARRDKVTGAAADNKDLKVKPQDFIKETREVLKSPAFRSLMDISKDELKDLTGDELLNFEETARKVKAREENEIQT